MAVRINPRRPPARRGPVSASGAPAARPPVASFETFYRAERSHVLAVVLMLIGDRAAAEDIVQDSFAIAYRKWLTVRHHDRPDAWVRRVALNRASSRLRRRRNERRALERLRARPTGSPTSGERNEELWAAVRRLPVRQAQAIALVYVEDMAIADVAIVLGCSVGSVKQHLSRGRARLAAMLEQERNER
jgi:RNA polymerase sigma-70 factor (ECF subfamily)